ncbi:hypothetical protein DFH06DRAFT_227796 [Mycena polygramma]|nr:hypothetical protein DFH06DRAFT_227796 [Mycena polygramma]
MPETNWATGAAAGQYDPWGGVPQPAQPSSSQWGNTIPPPAQLAAQYGPAAGGKGGDGGGGGGKKGNVQNQNQKGDKKGGKGQQQAWETWGMDTGRSAAEAWGNSQKKPGGKPVQAWENWGKDPRAAAATDAYSSWNTNAGGWDTGGGWGPAATDAGDWGIPQPSKHAQEYWGEEARRLPKLCSTTRIRDTMFVWLTSSKKAVDTIIRRAVNMSIRSSTKIKMAAVVKSSRKKRTSRKIRSSSSKASRNNSTPILGATAADGIRAAAVDGACPRKMSMANIRT